MVDAIVLKPQQNVGQPQTNVVQQTGSGNNGNIFDVLGNVAGNMANSCQQLAMDVAKIDLQNSYINRIKTMNSMIPMFGCWGGCLPIFTGGTIFPIYNQPAMQFPMFQTPTTQTVTQPMNNFMFAGACNHPINSAFRLTSTTHLPQFSSQGTSSLLPMYQDPPYDLNSYFGSQQQPQFQNCGQQNNSGQGFDITRILHPERYNQSQQQNNNQNSRAQVTATTAQQLGYNKRPDWYTDLLAMPQDKLNANQKRLKDIFEKNMIEYSPYLLDANGNPVRDDAGMAKTNPKIHNKIKNLYDALISHDDSRVLKLIKEYKPEELSAIDYHWRAYCEHSRGNKDNLTLRQMCQKSCLWGWADRLKFKIGNYKNIFNILNEKTLMNNPSSMADAFYQGMHEDAMLDHSIDSVGVTKLLEKLKDNKEYAKAVADEYQSRFGSSLSAELRHGKLKTNPQKVKDLAGQVFD